MKRLLFIRHGESLLNKERCVQGQLDSSLTERGIKQALCLLPELKKVKAETLTFSPLLRAKETADIIAEGLNIQGSVENKIMELFMGEWEEKSFQELIDGNKEIFHRFISNPADTEIPGAEKISLFKKRITEWLDNMLQMKENTHIIVTHAGVINTILCKVLDQDMNSLWHFKNDNCSICEITFNSGINRVLRINDTSHLEKKLKDSSKLVEKLNA